MPISLVRMLDRKLFLYSLILGFVISWMIKDPLTRWVSSGKGFDGRNIFYKLIIIIGLLISIAVLTYSLFTLIKRALNKLEKTKEQNRWIERFAFPMVTIAVAMFALIFMIRYAAQPLLEAHGFRQTQTALTSYWMIRDGWKLAYETPVVGFPWSIPFEFPIYQALVAWISQAGNFPLGIVGRSVSSVFLFACAWPAWKICKRLGLSNTTFWIFVILLWSSPFYLFWGRTFMIETAALFFTFAAVPYFIDLLSEKMVWKSAFFFVFWATLGVLQKTNTAIPTLFILSVLVLTKYLTRKPFLLPSWKRIALLVGVFLIPVIIGFTWSSFSNDVRTENIVGRILTSWPLTKWMMGSIQMRFDPQVIKTILWDRVFLQNAGGIIGVAILLAGFVWGNAKVRNLILICLALFIFPLAVFTNVHYIHDYYQASSLLFLIAALAISISSFLPDSTRNHYLHFLLTLIFIGSNFFWFFSGYRKAAIQKIDSTTNYLLSVSDIILNNTDPQSAVVIFGNDWSSEIGYFSERKSLAVMNEVFAEVWQNPKKYLGGLELGALVNCLNEPHPPSLKDFLLRDEIIKHPYVYQIRDCYIWMPDVQGVIIDAQGRTLLPLANEDLLKD